MEYGEIVRRAVNIVWQYKFLIVLGILASLGSGGGSQGNFNFGGNEGGTSQPFVEPGQFPEIVEPGQMPDLGGEIAGLAVGLIIAFACVALLVGIALWVVSTVARGGLIAGVDAIESGGKPSFRQAWGAGWQKLWSLLGIGFLPAIPGLLLFVLAILAAGAYGGLFALFGEEFVAPEGFAGIAIVVALLACVLLPIALILSILRVFAERACMLENLGAVDAYRRGYQVLRENLGEAIVLFLVQIGLSILLAILLFVPGLFALLCCCLWPLLIALQGAVSAVVSAAWTLAWHIWTGGPTIVEKSPSTI